MLALMITYRVFCRSAGYLPCAGFFHQPRNCGCLSSRRGVFNAFHELCSGGLILQQRQVHVRSLRCLQQRQGYVYSVQAVYSPRHTSKTAAKKRSSNKAHDFFGSLAVAVMALSSQRFHVSFTRSSMIRTHHHWLSCCPQNLSLLSPSCCALRNYPLPETRLKQEGTRASPSMNALQLPVGNLYAYRYLNCFSAIFTLPGAHAGSCSLPSVGPLKHEMVIRALFIVLREVTESTVMSSVHEA
jgi:hypothetical protein